MDDITENRSAILKEVISSVQRRTSSVDRNHFIISSNHVQLHEQTPPDLYPLCSAREHYLMNRDKYNMDSALLLFSKVRRAYCPIGQQDACFEVERYILLIFIANNSIFVGFYLAGKL
ncbi:hypothetical protein CEXT_232421 [Caerostris extrusa]|uniref:Uncharacterized protein n=1 Tax=Caerostris extrusa TaxID=172846 RepID=A0AAV4VY17_CAEEX|nr:hypothetical protein CEXT_232421 [Caerostris extrusa]